ncbi:hypothetical protein [Nitrosospira sp. Nl5]|uniref:hypothetical protein n=1 Tax=Nitrosospira sp. Nl5 TaxID=200120 RepID=UPI00210AEA20|nr:hypothetical protein [Nitrosospira sp. Nl5]
MMNKAFLLLALPNTLAYAASAFADEKVQWSDVPAQGQKTITSHAGGGKIEEVEKDARK